MRRARERPRIPWPVLTAVLAATLCVLRAVCLENYAGAFTSCHGCFLWPTLGHDAWLLSLLFALLGLRALARSRVAGILFGALAALLLAAMALDLGLFILLNQRLYLGDLLRFAGQIASNWSVASAQLFSLSGLSYTLLTLLVLAVAIGVIATRGRSPRQARVLFAGTVLGAIAAACIGWRSPLLYVHGQYTWNLVAINLPQGREKPFSAGHARQAEERSRNLPQTCAPGAATGTSVVIVLTESLSAYQSALLGGPHDWLPRLDALARGNHYFNRFYANGFGTDGGEIAAFTGRPPLDPPGRSWYELAAFGPGSGTLPAIAHEAGYGAYYFTTADLAFIDSGTWLRALGFDGVEGSEAAFYAHQPRGPFGAAPDAALFARFEQWLDQRADSGPFVAVLLTVTSHPPFLNPRDGKLDAEGTFRYVDAELADFHDRLDARGFFKSGLLMITGDHRSMTPLLADEYRRFGERAFARIPLIVAGAIDMPAVVTDAFQQSDIPASVAQILGVDYCRSAFNGRFLEAAPEPATYVVHSRGDDRNRVDVYIDDQVAAYAEAGDASGWTGSTPPPDAADVAAWIDAQRVRNATPTRTDAKP